MLGEQLLVYIAKETEMYKLVDSQLCGLLKTVEQLVTPFCEAAPTQP